MELSRGGGQTSSPPTLDDALSKLNQFDNRYEIGDTLTTSRTNLSNKWLLCNGATLNSADYPELGAQFPGVEMHFDKVAEYATGEGSSTTKYNYSLAVRQNENGTDSVIAYVAMSSSKMMKKNLTQDSNWINFSSIIATFSNASLDYPTPKTVNNKFFIIPRGNNYYSTTLFAMFCDGDPSSVSDFQRLQFPSTISKTPILDVMYSNGKYFFLTGSRRVLIYDDLSATPQIVIIGSDSAPNASVAQRFGVIDGNPSVTYSSGSSSNHYTAIFMTIGADGAITTLPVTKVTHGISSGSYYGSNIDFVLSSFSNKYAIIYNGSNTSGLQIKKIDSFDSWADDVWSVSSSSVTDGFDNYFSYNLIVNDKILVPTKQYINSGFGLKSWNSGPSFAGSFDQSSNYYYVMNVSGTTIQIWRSSKSTQFNLPTYSPATGLRAYIKAKN